ncbi:thioesterase family protein [Clostridium sp. DJ247]|uniref:thioesterase family protein n=1 Tax=Clostridium sp. DJ247 TaxID=2726188 RepID=UPI00162A0C01|nr:thioesterase family protein [Clostridium sp. DJ247]MBC2582593.1 thioesterase family protein [Clostridium sp. DJ247]
MDFNIKEGMTAVIETRVTENDTASKLGSGNLQVFATPAMIALMENASKSCVDLHLPYGYTTVGIEVNIRHIKASPIGIKIRCEAFLTKIEGKKLSFIVEASDENGRIGEGTHVRYIVNGDEFMKRILV